MFLLLSSREGLGRSNAEAWSSLKARCASKRVPARVHCKDGNVFTGWITAEVVKQIEQTYPLRRMGKPEDIANAVIFFASKQAEWITGQVLHVGGGNRM